MLAALHADFLIAGGSVWLETPRRRRAHRRLRRALLIAGLGLTEAAGIAGIAACVVALGLAVS